MDFIPLIFVCGNSRRTKPLGQSRSCPNCGAKNGAQLYKVRNKQQNKIYFTCRRALYPPFYLVLYYIHLNSFADIQPLQFLFRSLVVNWRQWPILPLQSLWSSVSRLKKETTVNNTSQLGYYVPAYCNTMHFLSIIYLV